MTPRLLLLGQRFEPVLPRFQRPPGAEGRSDPFPFPAVDQPEDPGGGAGDTDRQFQGLELERDFVGNQKLSPGEGVKMERGPLGAFDCATYE